MLNKKGVTLAELIITLAVSAILFNGIRVTYTSLDRRRVMATCRQLQGDLRYAQRLSVIEGREYILVFDMAAKNRYNVRYLNEDDGKAVQVKETYLPDGLTLSMKKPYMIEYGPKGTPQQGESKTITVTGKSFYQDITVGISGGRAEIKEIKPLKGY